jgi:hypothetical protein
MQMPITFRKEQFSRAYVAAVAAAAGYATSRPDPDIDKIDLTVHARGSEGHVRSPRVDLQLKCTEVDAGAGDALAFDLDRETYDILRAADYVVPRYLVVVVVPTNVSDWLEQTSEQLALRRCGYWLSLRDAPPTSNSVSQRVEIPRQQVLSVASLREMLARAGKEQT